MARKRSTVVDCIKIRPAGDSRQGPLDPGQARRVLLHFRKEEEVLLPVLDAGGLPARGRGIQATRSRPKVPFVYALIRAGSR
jgi:hypothetical protein